MDKISELGWLTGCVKHVGYNDSLNFLHFLFQFPRSLNLILQHALVLFYLVLVLGFYCQNTTCRIYLCSYLKLNLFNFNYLFLMYIYICFKDVCVSFEVGF
jgi:hypothetical protein